MSSPIITKLTLTPPTKTMAAAAYVCVPNPVQITKNLNFPAQMECTFEYDWQLHKTENDPVNPCQQRAYGTYQENGAYLFRGLAQEVIREQAGGSPVTRVTFLDKMQILNETLARWDDGTNVHSVWERHTGSEAIAEVRLYQGFPFTGGPYEVWYPLFSSAAWITTGGSLSITLGADFTAGVSTVMDLGTSATAAGFPPEGVLSFTTGGNTNFVQYQGKAYDESDGHYKAYNCKTTRFGSTAANGTSGVTVVYLRLLKRIHFDREPRVRGYESGGGTYETIPNDQYDKLITDGTFGFKESPLNLRRKTGGASAVYDYPVVAYNVFAEEDVTKQLLLSDALNDVLVITAANRGPGFTAGTLSIVISPDPVLTQVRVDKPTTAMEFIKGVLNDIGLLKGSANDLIAMWYAAADDKLHIESIAQGAITDAATKHYHNEQRIYEETQMEDVCSAIEVGYEDQALGNLCASNRVWHTPSPSNGGTPGGPAGGAEPYIFHFLSTANWQPGYSGYKGSVSGLLLGYVNDTRVVTALTAAGVGATGLLMDQDTETGFAIGWDNATDPVGKYIYFWFDGPNATTATARFFGEVTIVLDMQGDGPTATTGPRFTVYYFDDLVPQADAGGTAAIPTSVHGAQYLDARLTREWLGGTLSDEGLIIRAGNLLAYGNAIAIKIEAPLAFKPDGATTFYGIKIKDVLVRPPAISTVHSQLRAAYSTADTNYITAPLSYGKIVDTTVGRHKVGILDLGGFSKLSAQYFAQLQLLQSLVISEPRTFSIESDGLDWSGVPEVASTAFFSEAFGGVLDTIEYTLDSGYRSLVLRAVNYDTNIFGQGV